MNVEIINSLKQKIAFLEDGYTYQKDMADLYAKELKRIWNSLDDLQERYDEYDDIIYPELEEIKNSIPESALNR
jgi:hypothetical protein